MFSLSHGLRQSAQAFVVTQGSKNLALKTEIPDRRVEVFGLLELRGEA